MRCDDEPTCRATIRDGTLTLNRWSPSLYRAGPAPAALAHVTAALADLSMLEGDELLVIPVPGTRWGDGAEATLTAWARRVGHHRIWLPDRVITLDELPELGRVVVTCPTCGACWEDATVGFWAMVRDHGWFPGACRACGGSLPEWSSAEVLADTR